MFSCIPTWVSSKILEWTSLLRDKTIFLASFIVFIHIFNKNSLLKLFKLRQILSISSSFSKFAVSNFQLFLVCSSLHQRSAQQERAQVNKEVEIWSQDQISPYFLHVVWPMCLCIIKRNYRHFFVVVFQVLHN